MLSSIQNLYMYKNPLQLPIAVVLVVVYMFANKERPHSSSTLKQYLFLPPGIASVSLLIRESRKRR
jgi:hypothetical protein